MSAIQTEGLFDAVVSMPDPEAQRRYAELVGLDETKRELDLRAKLLLNPEQLTDWSQRHYRTVLPAVERLRGRPPLFVFGGDVGTGKTTLAETFADPISRSEGIPITLMSMSLNARGSGAVGEMTSLISKAFEAVKEEAPRGGTDKPRKAVVLLIDEGDALAQSRELGQMHHEDRAGVNALIRGVSHIDSERRPVITVLCTNRLSVIDPAVRRRATAIFEFRRPNLEQRLAVFRKALEGSGFVDEQLHALAEITGEDGRAVGFTYSDLTDRVLPALLLDALPDEPLHFERAIEVVTRLEPTPPQGAGLA
jgi:AAA+ superfamily predicted ATPase